MTSSDKTPEPATPRSIGAQAGENEPVQFWPEELSSTEIRRFKSYVYRAFEKRGMRITGDLPLYVLDTPHGGAQGSVRNLAVLCAGKAQREWKAEIAHHVKVLDSVQRFTGLSAEVARSSLRIRILGQDHGLDFVVTRPSMPGLVAALYVRRPGAGQAVSTEMFDEWGFDVDEAFATADENTARLEGAYTKQLEGFQCLFGDSMFASAGVVRLPEWCDLDSGGAIVSVPNRHTVLARPLTNDSLDLLLPMSAITNHLVGAVPGPCSGHLWFVSADTFGDYGEGAELIEQMFDADTSDNSQSPTFHPGPCFSQALARFERRAA